MAQGCEIPPAILRIEYAGMHLDPQITAIEKTIECQLMPYTDQ